MTWVTHLITACALAQLFKWRTHFTTWHKSQLSTSLKKKKKILKIQIQSSMTAQEIVQFMFRGWDSLFDSLSEAHCELVIGDKQVSPLNMHLPYRSVCPPICFCFHPSETVNQEQSLVFRLKVFDGYSCHASPTNCSLAKGQTSCGPAAPPSSTYPRPASPDNTKSHCLALSCAQAILHGSADEQANSGWAETAIGKQKQAWDVSDEVTAGTNWCWQTAIRRVVVAWHQLSVTQVFSQCVNHVLWKAEQLWITECMTNYGGYKVFTSLITEYVKVQREDWRPCAEKERDIIFSTVCNEIQHRKWATYMACSPDAET